MGFLYTFFTYLKFKVGSRNFDQTIQQCLFQTVFIVLIPNRRHSFYSSAAASCYSSKCSFYSKSSLQFLFQTVFIVLSVLSTASHVIDPSFFSETPLRKLKYLFIKHHSSFFLSSCSSLMVYEKPECSIWTPSTFFHFCENFHYNIL